MKPALGGLEHEDCPGFEPSETLSWKQQGNKVKQKEKEFCLTGREALCVEKKNLFLQDNNHKEVNIWKNATLYHGDN